MAEKAGDSTGAKPSAAKSATGLTEILGRAKNTTGKVQPFPNVFFKRDYFFKDFLTKNSLEDRPQTLAAYALLKAGDRDFPKTSTEATPEVTVTTSQVVIDGFLTSATRWFIELVACQQVSKLDDKNYENYYRSMNCEYVPWKVADIVDYLSAVHDKIVEVEGFQEILQTSTFVKYHTSASSTPGLMRRAMDAAPFGGIFSDEEIDALGEAEKGFHKVGLAQLIPPRAVVMTYIILEAANALPNNWYMGNRAVAQYPPHKYSSLLAIMKKSMKVSSGLDVLDQLADIQSLEALFRETRGD